jgi:flavin-dependent dehydrogenase
MTQLLRGRSGRVEGVRGRDRSGAFEVLADLVVGADGVRSPVAAAVGARTHWRGTARGMAIYSYFEGIDADGIEWHYGPGVAAGVVPTNDGAACVYAGTATPAADRTGNTLGQQFERILDAVSPTLARRIAQASRVERFHGYGGRVGQLRQAHGSGWALVGDAGYFKDPVSAHGITDAFIGAELLSDAIADTVRYGVDEGVALEGYARERDEMAAAMMPPTAAIAGLGSDMSVVKQSFIDIAAAMRDEYVMLLGRERVPTAA